MLHPDQWPTTLELITAEWLPPQTARDAAGKADRRGRGAAVLRLRRRPWRTASLQWRRPAAPGESDNQDCGRFPNSCKHRRPAMDRLARLYATAQLGDELALVLFFSLTGLDLTLWLLTKGPLAGALGLFAALTPG
jgi:hypothetical protein